MSRRQLREGHWRRAQARGKRVLLQLLHLRAHQRERHHVLRPHLVMSELNCPPAKSPSIPAVQHLLDQLTDRVKELQLKKSLTVSLGQSIRKLRHKCAAR